MMYRTIRLIAALACAAAVSGGGSAHAATAAPQLAAKERPPIRDHTRSVEGLALADGGDVLFTGGFDDKVLAYRLGAAGAEVPTYGFTQGNGVQDVAVWADGRGVRGLFTASRTVFDNAGGQLRWTSVDGKRSRSLSAAAGEGFRAVAVVPPGLLAVGGGRDKGQVRLLDLTGFDLRDPRGTPLADLEVRPVAPPLPSRVTRVAFRPPVPGKTTFELLAGCADGSVHHFDVGKRWINPTALHLVGHDQPVTGLAYARDGKTVVTSGHDGTVRFWDAATGLELDPVRRIVGAPPVFALTWSPDGRYVLTAHQDGALRFWDAGSRALALELKAGEMPLRCVAAAAVPGAANAWRVAAGGEDFAVRVWDVTAAPAKGPPAVARGPAAAAAPPPRPQAKAPPQATPPPAGLVDAGRPKPSPSAPPGGAGVPPRAGRTVDLMPLVDLDRDVVRGRGRWAKADGRLAYDGQWAEGNVTAGVRAGYEPPAEYDYRVTFTASDKDADVHLLLAQGDRPFEVLLQGGAKPAVRVGSWKDPQALTTAEPLEPGVPHRAVVQVRADHVAVSVDDKPAARCRTDGGYGGPPPWVYVGDRNLGVWVDRRAVSFAALEVVEVTGAGREGRQTTLGEPPGLAGHRPPEDKPLRVVDLMPLIDPKAGAAGGVWTRDGNELRVEAGPGESRLRLAIPYAPPPEYDLRVAFTRTGDHQDVALLLPAGKGTAGFFMGCLANTSCGFANVGGQWRADGPGAVRAPGMLVNGRRYSAVVHVRRDRVAASIDGRLVVEHRTDGSDLAVPSDWAVGGGGPLAVGSFWGPVTFHAIEIAEVTGAGRPVGPAVAVPPVPPPGVAKKPQPGKGKSLFED